MSEPRLQAAITPIRRPGKDEGISATANGGGYELLYVFTSGAPPFEQNTSYSKFAACALLEHDGNYGAAAKVLAEREKHHSHHLHRRDVSSIGRPQAGGHESPRSGDESLSGFRLRQWREEDMRAPRWVWENRILLGALNSFG